MKDLILLLRPNQWLKNVFIFVPLFFDKHIFDWQYLWPSLIAFVAYCLVASSIYCFNDIWDVEADKIHPQKCKRPIASGNVSTKSGYIIMAVTFLLGIISAILLLPKQTKFEVIGIIIFYYLMNIAYCVKLKQKALIDVFIIALGFVLRIIVGGKATGIWMSHWIIVMTFLLALFLAFAKRRDDVVFYEDTGVQIRKNVNRYNLSFMDHAVTMLATITMVAYIMYTMSPDVINRLHTNYLYITSVWVLLGILRYLQLTIVEVKSGSPTKVLMKDGFTKYCIIGWIITFSVILYF